MKLRYITAVFTLGLLLLVLFGSRGISSREYDTVDMVSLNAKYKEISSALNLGGNREELEKEFGCQIYLKTDSNYADEVNEALRYHKISLDYTTGDMLLGKIIFPGMGEQLEQQQLILQRRMIFAGAAVLLLGYLLIGLLYYFYIHPFQKLQSFASEVAKGNMDQPLYIHKKYYFGAFTESFDLMREELKLAKENEYKANISKKELVAGLSHDIKTPVAAIKAACEVLKIKILMAETREEKESNLKKIELIEKKSDMIDSLIGNMFHATLEELDNLPVEPLEESCLVIADMMEEVEIKNEIPECLIYMDRLRLKQVIDNIVNNSFKYAGTRVKADFLEQKDGIIVKLRDDGMGVSEEELPLVMQKYYRGSNGKGKSGAGLGLFLSAYFMEHMKGSMECYNDNGFVVELYLRKV